MTLQKKIIKTPDRPRPDPIDCTKLSNRPVRCSISKCSVSINSNFNFDCQSQSGHTKIEKRQIVSIVDKIIKSDKGVKLVRKIDPKYKIGTSNSIFDNDSITYINHNINIRGIAQKNADTSKLKLNVLNVLLVTLKTIHSRLRKNLNNKTMNHNTKIAYKAINSVAKLYNLFCGIHKKNCKIINEINEIKSEISSDTKKDQRKKHDKSPVKKPHKRRHDKSPVKRPDSVTPTPSPGPSPHKRKHDKSPVKKPHKKRHDKSPVKRPDSVTPSPSPGPSPHKRKHDKSPVKKPHKKRHDKSPVKRPDSVTPSPSRGPSPHKKETR